MIGFANQNTRRQGGNAAFFAQFMGNVPVPAPAQVHVPTPTRGNNQLPFWARNNTPLQTGGNNIGLPLGNPKAPVVKNVSDLPVRSPKGRSIGVRLDKRNPTNDKWKPNSTGESRVGKTVHNASGGIFVHIKDGETVVSVVLENSGKLNPAYGKRENNETHAHAAFRECLEELWNVSVDLISPEMNDEMTRRFKAAPKVYIPTHSGKFSEVCVIANSPLVPSQRTLMHNKDVVNPIRHLLDGGGDGLNETTEVVHIPLADAIQIGMMHAHSPTVVVNGKRYVVSDFLAKIFHKCVVTGIF